MKKKTKKVWVVLYRYGGDVRYGTDMAFDRKADAMEHLAKREVNFLDIPHIVRSVEVPE